MNKLLLRIDGDNANINYLGNSSTFNSQDMFPVQIYIQPQIKKIEIYIII